MVAAVCLSMSWISSREFLGLLGNHTGAFPEWVSQNCSIAPPNICGWSPFGGDVWIATLGSCVFPSFWVFYVVSVRFFFKCLACGGPRMSPGVAATQPQRLIEDLLVWWFPFFQVQFESWRVSRSSDTLICNINCALLLYLFLSCRFPFLVRQYNWCTGFKKAFTFGVVRFSTCLSEWVDNSWFCVLSGLVVFVVFVVSSFFRVRIFWATVVIPRTSFDASFFLAFHWRPWYL